MTRNTLLSFMCLALIFIVGCADRGDRPKLGTVTGTVTVNGKPEADIMVAFAMPGFRASRGLTDENGEYELKYLKGVKGAAIGEHKVKLTYFSIEEGKKTKRLPSKYNHKTELFREVTSGSNKIDFELTTE